MVCLYDLVLDMISDIIYSSIYLRNDIHMKCMLLVRWKVQEGLRGILFSHLKIQLLRSCIHNVTHSWRGSRTLARFRESFQIAVGFLATCTWLLHVHKDSLELVILSFFICCLFDVTVYFLYFPLCLPELWSAMNLLTELIQSFTQIR